MTATSKTEETTRFENFGKASILVGLTEAIRVLTARREQLLAEISGSEPVREKRKYTKRAAPAADGMSPQQRYWANLTPEARAAEMKRRGMSGKRTEAVKQSPPVPVKKKHPGSSRWATSLTPEQKAEHGRKISIAVKKSNAAKKKAAAAQQKAAA